MMQQYASAPGHTTANDEVGGDADRAIIASRIVKEFETEIGIRRVLDGISFRVGMGERMAVLGRNGAGKSTLIQILSGLQLPTSGTIHRGLRMSWPLALGGGFEGELTGYDNIRFISRIYDVPFRATYEFVEGWASYCIHLCASIQAACACE